MILIDALHINDSGGKILLNYLIKSIEESNLEVFYLLDDRIKNNHSIIKKNNVFYLKSTFLNRLKFYLKSKSLFKKVFCFANIPPPLKLKALTFTYFHQKLFLKLPKKVKFQTKIIFFIKSKIIKHLSSNVDFWIVQTVLMKEDLLKKFKIKKNSNILVLPFYSPFNYIFEKSIVRENKSFLYVSTYSSHKNFENLLLGFKHFYDKNNCGVLNLTLSENSGQILLEINKLLVEGYPIINHGFVNRKKLKKLYSSNEYLVYPSYSESFGLGIIEGIENGCKVIGADLPYLNAVCKPSLTFNPYSIESIADSFEIAIKNDLKKTKQLVHNEINKILNLLK